MSEFPTYEVTVRVETEGDQKYGWSTIATVPSGDALAICPPLARSEPEARANHAVACADVGIPNVWPVSAGKHRVTTVRGDYCVTYVRRSTDGLLIGRYVWSTEAEAVEGHNAVARRWGVAL